MNVATALAGLHVLADATPAWPNDPIEQARAACAGGADVVQLRAKLTIDRETLDLAREIRALTRAANVLFIVNDRFDLALVSEADGVHLGQDDLAPARIPAPLRGRLLIGRSTHDEAQLRAAAKEPLDYVAFGPVFRTDSKATGWSARGVPGLRRAVTLTSPRPLVAIGGIDAANAGDIAAAGAGAAVISAIANAPDMLAATRTLKRSLAEAGGTTS